MQLRIFFNTSVFAILWPLTGCHGFNPVIDTAGYLWGSESTNASFTLGFEYLQVDWQGRKSFMALGYRETQGSQVSERWYSGQGEMMQLINGRIMQVFGMVKEVRDVSTNPPAWADILSRPTPIVWSQTKEVMPGYRFGVTEFVLSQPSTITTSEKALAADATAWVVEEVKSKSEKGRPWVYQQRFALLNDRVVYSEQCFAQEMCFKLKPMGVVVPK